MTDNSRRCSTGRTVTPVTVRSRVRRLFSQTAIRMGSGTVYGRHGEESIRSEPTEVTSVLFSNCSNVGPILYGDCRYSRDVKRSKRSKRTNNLNSNKQSFRWVHNWHTYCSHAMKTFYLLAGCICNVLVYNLLRLFCSKVFFALHYLVRGWK